MGIGSTLAEVYAAYAEQATSSPPDREPPADTRQASFSIPASEDFPVGAALHFDFADGVVTAIFVTARAW